MAKAQLRFRDRVCKNCDRTFVYEVGKGRDRLHCNDQCRIAYQISQRIPKSQWPKCHTLGCRNTVRSSGEKICNACYAIDAKAKAGTCAVHKCQRPATRVGARLCDMHYCRVRRNGNLYARPLTERFLTNAGYVKRRAIGHPLTNKDGFVFEHRLVAYEAHGVGPHPCHWCGAMLTWSKIVVDHLNEKKADNIPSNLVISCGPCNRIRGAMVPFIRRMLPDRIADFVRTFDYMRQGSTVSPRQATSF